MRPETTFDMTNRIIDRHQQEIPESLVRFLMSEDCDAYPEPVVESRAFLVEMIIIAIGGMASGCALGVVGWLIFRGLEALWRVIP